MSSFQEKMVFLLCPSEEISSNCTWKVSHALSDRSSKQNRQPEIDLKMSKQQAGIATAIATQTNRAL